MLINTHQIEKIYTSINTGIPSYTHCFAWHSIQKWVTECAITTGQPDE